MDYKNFEQRLLETIFTTDVPLTPASLAFLYRIPAEEASSLLQKAAIAGIVNMDNDEQGNIIYTYPNRVRLVPQAPSNTRPTAGGQPVPVVISPGIAFGSQMPGRPMFPHQTPVQQPGAGQAASTQQQAFGFVGQSSPKAPQGTTECLFCRQVILVGTKQCPHCHETLDFYARQQAQGGHAAPFVTYPMYHQPAAQPVRALGSTEAALLSFFLPGLGQICNGRVGNGLMWMAATVLGYFALVVPGIVLHVLCVVNAAKQAQQPGRPA